MDHRTGKSRGFGFVRYKYAHEASKALKRLDGEIVDGRGIMVRFAKHANDRGKEIIHNSTPKKRARIIYEDDAASNEMRLEHSLSKHEEENCLALLNEVHRCEMIIGSTNRRLDLVPILPENCRRKQRVRRRRRVRGLKKKLKDTKERMQLAVSELNSFEILHASSWHHLTLIDSYLKKECIVKATGDALEDDATLKKMKHFVAAKTHITLLMS